MPGGPPLEMSTADMLSNAKNGRKDNRKGEGAQPQNSKQGVSRSGHEVIEFWQHITHHGRFAWGVRGLVMVMVLHERKKNS